MNNKIFQIKENPPFCAALGCMKSGLYPAPKGLNNRKEFYYFCLEHIRAYNASWDALDGLSEAQIEKEIRKATLWERPTWPFAQRTASPHRASKKAPTKEEIFSPELRSALSVLELQPPANFIQIKTQYRRLVKTYHPDARGGSGAYVEKFMAVQQAFATLRNVYAKPNKTGTK